MADVVDPDDILTREESALVSKASREMWEGKYVSFAQLEPDLARSDVSSAPERLKAVLHPTALDGAY